MHRKAYAPGLAALLVALLAGCTADSGTDGSAIDSKSGSGTSPAAPPGKYRTLREPCGSVPLSTLKDLLPGTAELPDEQQQKIFRGTTALTYDTDRRVGCGWKADSPDASHHLSVDFERVVSYDEAVSGVDRAKEVFARKQAAASRPIADPSAGQSEDAPSASSSSSKPTTGATPTNGTPTGSPTEAPTGSPTGTPSGSASGSPDGLEPRALDSLGDAAFIDDVLTGAGVGSTAQRRTVSVVFRTSNVIVTIVYGEQSARTTEVPDSKELQDRAQSLAHKLAEEFSG